MSNGGTTEGRRGLFALPSSSVGRVSGGLLLAAVIGVAVNSALIMPLAEGRTGLGAAQSVVNAAIGLCLLAAGVIGAWAVIRLRERSWVLFLAIVLTLVVLLFNIPWDS